ncbi:nitrite/sulfite reductase [Clostridium sp. LP20]|uniref:nitrite/sulfite reductase n=1 Tax=Clostridium sp. LP20 TaxID=3418665 RepID=UPI003EE496BE
MDNFKKILLDEIEEFRQIGHKFLNGELTVPQFKHASGGMGVYAHRGGKEFMVRIRIPSGVTHVDELRLVYDFAKKNNLEGIHLTTRQAIQLHGMDIDSICDLMKEGLDLNLFTRGSGGNFPRNVALSPLAGVDKDEPFDVTPYALAVGNHFLKKIYTYKLPRKFKVSFSNTKEDTAHCTVQDLGFIACKDGDKDMFKVYIGGGLGNNPKKAIELDELAEPKDVLYYVEGMTNLFINEGDYENRNKARIRYIADRMGDEEFIKEFKKYVAIEKEKGELELHLHSNEINKKGIKLDIKHKRLYEQKQEGLYSVYLHPVGGQLKLSNLKEILDTLERFADVDIRLAMTEGVYFRNLNGEEAKIILDLTDKMGGRTEIEHSVSCIGVPTCQVGIANSQGLLSSIIKYFKEKGYKSDVLPKVFISGCANSCGVHEIASIGFTGKKKRVNDAVQEVFQLQLGGACSVGSTSLGIAKGEMLTETIPEFLYKLSEEVDKSGVTFEEYMKNNINDLDKLIDKYIV